MSTLASSNGIEGTPLFDFNVVKRSAFAVKTMETAVSNKDYSNFVGSARELSENVVRLVKMSTSLALMDIANELKIGAKEVLGTAKNAYIHKSDDALQEFQMALKTVAKVIVHLVGAWKRLNTNPATENSNGNTGNTVTTLVKETTSVEFGRKISEDTNRTSSNVTLVTKSVDIPPKNLVKQTPNSSIPEHQIEEKDPPVHQDPSPQGSPRLTKSSDDKIKAYKIAPQHKKKDPFESSLAKKKREIALTQTFLPTPTDNDDTDSNNDVQITTSSQPQETPQKFVKSISPEDQTQTPTKPTFPTAKPANGTSLFGLSERDIIRIRHLKFVFAMHRPNMRLILKNQP